GRAGRAPGGLFQAGAQAGGDELLRAPELRRAAARERSASGELSRRPALEAGVPVDLPDRGLDRGLDGDATADAERGARVRARGGDLVPLLRDHARGAGAGTQRRAAAVRGSVVGGRGVRVGGAVDDGESAAALRSRAHWGLPRGRADLSAPSRIVWPSTSPRRI